LLCDERAIGKNRESWKTNVETTAVIQEGKDSPGFDQGYFERRGIKGKDAS
jgi:hypothetical protein